MSNPSPNLQQLAELTQRLEQADYEWYMRERLLAEMVTQSPYGLIACNRDGRFIVWNEKATELIGRGSPTFTVDNWSAICKLKWASDKKTLFSGLDCPLARALKGEVVECAYMWIGDEKTGRMLRCSAKPISDSTSLIGAVLIFFDNAIPTGDPGNEPKRAISGG